MHILIHILLRIPIRTPNPESVSSTPTITITLVRTHHWCYLAVATESAHPSTTQASSLHAIPPPWILHPTAVTTPMPPRPKAYIRLRPVPLVPFRFSLHSTTVSVAIAHELSGRQHKRVCAAQLCPASAYLRHIVPLHHHICHPSHMSHPVPAHPPACHCPHTSAPYHSFM